MAGTIDLGSAMDAARVALDGLSLRQSAIAQNMANVDTPGYQAQTVSFEDAVKAVLKNDSSFKLTTTDTNHISLRNESAVAATVLRQGGSYRADENNVDIDVEMVDQVETELRYETISKMVSGKYTLLTDIINSR